MKKVIIALFFAVISVCVNAQSIQFHQGYDFKVNSPSQKVIVDFFWTNDSWNVFSWNNFGINYNSIVPGSTDATSLLYVEYKLGNSNFYLHPEVRLNTFCENYYQFGFAYLLPFKSVAIYLTPKYSYHGYHDFQFSINSSYESDHFYYEGYIDTDWISPCKFNVNFWAEQKFYYKVTERFHFGINLLFGGDFINGFTNIAPMFVGRVSLY